jgi:hypothetical protein
MQFLHLQWFLKYYHLFFRKHSSILGFGDYCVFIYICSMDASPALYAFIAGGPLDFAAVHPELPENR